ncbi:phosphoenolpyruvate--protein phosphotransferase [Kingella negevensis]|uniref:Phosphoenolpyruvate-protein phosphotransferase n=1 Tax=Kingella negevensis TaxID=1522312 RepID=A0A238TB82_9NEIS|nr:phosphoenolpyruvate--protein phosphotransferase [Kingella negevensis]MDK4681338.1 phosphoenolpyruvate--protein phosphotransferase [Kingella negevensis]MDK4683535.1 phosphoenolpyruvate--protein phosphotransferase [Kingella negevensis]MDK4691330.1 phosphoenolpyruvate--protein phosphotransferase [Kingella negevensis]MDK4693521.1 phosphoenolpyruvate--protein phosphotransferase [Kingella negevensis]MDK4697419.1 phosphoenolpyruvate--protein phosphotransferase [Kingella negevensis]
MIVLHGYAAGKGIAIGRAHLVVRGVSEVPQYSLKSEEIPNEIARFEAAIKTTRRQLEQLRSAIPENAPTELGAFISLHLMLLTDVTLSREPIDILQDQAINAEWALKLQTERLSQQFDEIDDEYLRQRKQDMLQVVERLQKNLIGQSTEINLEATLLDDTILIAHDLSPADTVYFKDQRIEGFVTDMGGQTSHTAILGRSLNIPSVIGLGNARRLIREHEWVIVDGMSGVLIIDPDELVLAEYRRRQKEFRSHQRALNKLKKTAAETRDGEQIELLANIENVDDIKAVHNFGADGVGLFRSEFLFLNRDTLPEEDEQYLVYSELVKKMKGKSLTIRTVDLGVDKNPRWFGNNGTPNAALNPALGLTGIRLCHAEPVMFRTQMRAILRAAAHGKVKMMFPMIASLSELKQSLVHLETARKQLAERGEAFGDVELGCMIEIPSAALTVSSLLKFVDFVSIGTNDLIQYTLGVDRNDDSVSYLYQPAHPAIVKLLAHIIRSANRMGKHVAVCGEMAGDTRFTRLLLGLGLRSFSMNTANLLAIKDVVLRSHAERLESDMGKILRNEDPDKSDVLLKKLNEMENAA